MPRARLRGGGLGRAGPQPHDEVGELVITEPMPSMPLFLWGDHDGERLRESYFAMYPGHLAPRRLDPHHPARRRGDLRPLGLDDQPPGRAHGHERDLPRRGRPCAEVLDALVVDVPAAGTMRGERAVDGAVRRAARGATLDEELQRTIKRRIREDCSPRHVPNEILAIDEVPRTLSGKVLGGAGQEILMGTPLEQAASVDSLANPRSLDYFVELAKTLDFEAVGPAAQRTRRGLHRARTGSRSVLRAPSSARRSPS